jgi:hypothetical protein
VLRYKIETLDGVHTGWVTICYFADRIVWTCSDLQDKPYRYGSRSR